MSAWVAACIYGSATETETSKQHCSLSCNPDNIPDVIPGHHHQPPRGTEKNCAFKGTGAQNQLLVLYFRVLVLSMRCREGQMPRFAGFVLVVRTHRHLLDAAQLTQKQPTTPTRRHGLHEFLKLEAPHMGLYVHNPSPPPPKHPPPPTWEAPSTPILTASESFAAGPPHPIKFSSLCI
jgi:hypothetical protein